MKTLLLILLVLTITTLNLKAEPLTGQAKLDSLLAELPRVKGDTNEVKLLSSISFSYYSTNPDEGIEYGLKGLELAKKISWKQGEAVSINSLGANYYSKSDYPKVLELCGKALKIEEELGNKNGIASNLGNMGLVYQNQSDYPKALEYYGKALKIDEELGNKNGIASNLGNMGIVYQNQSDYPKALEYYTKALMINEELGNKSGIANTLGNMGNIYNYQSDYPKALEYYGKALKINEELGNKRSIANNLINIGNLYISINELDKSLDYLNRGLVLNEKIGDTRQVNYTLNMLAANYIARARQIDSFQNLGEIPQVTSLINKEQNYKKALEFGLRAEALADSIGLGELQHGIYEQVSTAYEGLGRFEKSLEYHKKFQMKKDSVFSQENSDKIVALEKAREDDLKQKEIEKQKIRIAEQEKREQLILYFSIGLVLLMTVVMIVIYRLLKRSDKLLYNVLPVSIAKRLKKKEHPISDYFTQASIVFIDIVNFTELSKDEDPRRVVELLNKIFTKYDTISNKYGLEKIKTIGDSYMAAAGIPEVQKDNTHRAAQMALEVKAMMKDEVHVSERFKDAVTEYEEFSYVERGEIKIKGKGKMKTFFMGSKETVIQKRSSS